MATGFFEKMVTHWDKLSAESLQALMLRLSKERMFLETLFQRIQEGIVVIDPAGRLVYANRAAETFIGLDAAKQRGKSIRRYLQEMEWEELVGTNHSEGWARSESRLIEVTYPNHRFLSLYALPIDRDEVNGEILLMLRDVTEQHKQTETVIESERLDAVRNLAAGVAHEIGNPLNALTIHLQLLGRELRAVEDEETRASLKELTEVAEHEVTRLDAIIRQFLQALRPAPPKLVPGDLTEVVRNTLRVLKTDLENRCIQVQVSIPERLPAVSFDAQQMEQVFFNILKNAMEAIPDGGRIGITCTFNDVWVNLSFLDNGSGIAPDKLGQIFEPYVTTKAKGTGLGLMIVQRIIQDHGGAIETASKVNEGTCFTIRLPRTERRIRALPRMDDARADEACIEEPRTEDFES